ncbi:MAG: ABC transporter ATP-binding protein [Pelagimonas sp.]|uniref:ABC transporter ATP-binding protein n=1 Tax=Pelagimonas sp. TaxID=2073170 RepID=UPI003D6A69FB
MSISMTDIRSGYDRFRLNGITAEIQQGSLTALIGPNGCGKSTLLKTIARHLNPGGGRVMIAGRDIARMRPRDIAKVIAVMPQQPIVPGQITVDRLVGYGRAPHQNFLGFVTAKDRLMIDAALETVGLRELRHDPVANLSGGQRQRAFIAMCIAQDTPYVLFDEPTSFLDIRYQYDVLELLKQLQQSGKTVVAVLHDIAQAARYATDLLVLKDSNLAHIGNPAEVVTADMVSQVYDLKAHVYPDPVTGTNVISPKTRMAN